MRAQHHLRKRFNFLHRPTPSRLSLLLAFLAILFFSVRAFHGIWFLPFVDEAEHLVGGMMLNHGAILYRTFVDAHGPTVYMLTQSYGAVFGWSHPNGARVIIVALALLVGGCVIASPISQNRIVRLNGAALYFGLLAAVWLLQALYMVNYHMLAGLLGGAALALLVAPVWVGAKIDTWRAISGGVCLTLMAATAYSFGPAACLLGISTIWAGIRSSNRTLCWNVAAGVVAGILGVIFWLAIFGDIKGYFVFHFLFNQFVFSHYLPLNLQYFLASLIPSIQPASVVHCLALVSWAVACTALLVLDTLRAPGTVRMAGPIILGFAGLLALCARGGTSFQEGSFDVCAIVIVSLAVPSVLAKLGDCQGISSHPSWSLACTCLIGASIAFAEVSMRRALDSPWNITRAQMVTEPRFELGQSDAPIDVRIRALTKAGDRILAMPFEPDIYLASGRMPMDGYNYYLPADADYGRAPWLGVKHDLCADWAKRPPKLVYFNNWVVWDKYAMADYAPCVLQILSSKYQRQTDFPELYLRRDQPT